MNLKLLTLNSALADLDTSLNSSIDGLYFQKGDSFSIADLRTGGYVTTSSANIYFIIPLCKPVASGVSVSVSCSLTIRQGGNYTHGSSSSSSVTPSSISTTVRTSFISVVATMSSTTNASNNDACGVAVSSGTVSFS